MEEEKKILSKAADTIISKPVTITIDVLKFSWLSRRLQKPIYNQQEVDIPKQLTGIRKWLYNRYCIKTFEIKQAPLGTLIKISKELIDIDLRVFDSENLLESNYHLIENHGERMARIAAIAVSNAREEPPKKIVGFFMENLNTKDLFKVASIVLQQMDIGNFMNTIISIKGTNVLQQRNVSAISANNKEVSR